MMLLLSNSRNHAQGLLRDGRGGCAASAVSGSRAPGRRFPVGLGLVSYSLSFAVFNLAFANVEIGFCRFIFGTCRFSFATWQILFATSQFRDCHVTMFLRLLAFAILGGFILQRCRRRHRLLESYPPPFGLAGFFLPESLVLPWLSLPLAIRPCSVMRLADANGSSPFSTAGMSCSARTSLMVFAPV